MNPQDVKILVIDDEMLTIQAVSSNFEIFGFQVEKVLDVQVAEELLSEQSFDIVILDWHMPCGGGERILKVVRSLDWQKPAVFLMTGDRLVEESYVFNLGADGFLYKPFEAAQTRDLIQQSCISRTNRWLTPFRMDAQFSMQQQTKSLDGSDRSLHLGRGGFFVSRDCDFPEAEDVVEFAIHVEEDELCRRISGRGIVRWIRSKADGDKGLASGFGVEIKYLEDMGRDLFIEWVEKNKPVPFIPHTI